MNETPPEAPPEAQAEPRYSRRELVTFATQMSRMALAKSLGQTTAYGGARDYDTVLGYPKDIAFGDYLQRYERQDIAGPIVDLPAQDSYKRPPRIMDGEKPDTPFCEAWNELETGQRVWSKLSRADKLSGIGEFGILVIGLKDGQPLGAPVEVKLTGPDDVLYLRPYSQGKTKITTYEDDTQSKRYGLPVIYEIKPKDEGDWVKIHWMRVLHLAEDKGSSEIFGTPRLQRVYNRLDDLMKLVGGTAEATWLNMRPGTLMTNREGYDVGKMTDADVEDQIERYAHDPLRFLWLQGADAQQIGAAEVMDPSNPFNVCLQLISAASGIPQRVLVGSAQGELAAAEWDFKQWAGEIRYRQTNYVEPEIVRPFVDRMIEFGVLPEPADEYHFGELDKGGTWHWPPLIDMTEGELAEIMQRRAGAVAQLAGIETGERITDAEIRDLMGLPVELDADIAVNAAARIARDNYAAGSLADVVYREYLRGELETLK